MTRKFGGKIIETDGEGDLENLSDWSETLAEHLAVADAIELSSNHWEVNNILQQYYNAYQVVPAVRILTRTVGKKPWKDKGYSSSSGCNASNTMEAV